jgi:tRNA(Arg) A34 adenosine deaminase TadA
MTDMEFMNEALSQAQQAADRGEVPVGAIVVLDGVIIGRGFNSMISAHDPSAHAEIQAIRQAAATIGNYRLSGAEVFVTLEPCSMCAGAMVHARIARLVFAAREPKAGVAVSKARFFDQPFLNHRVEVSEGVQEQACSDLLSAFFSTRRKAIRNSKLTLP